MATIVIDKKQITLNSTNKVSFLDDSSGMDVTVIPRQLNYNMETEGATVHAVGRYISPTGMVINEVQLGSLNFDLSFSEFDSPVFRTKYINGLFRSLLSRFGLTAHQIINPETHAIEVIKDATAPEIPAPETTEP